VLLNRQPIYDGGFLSGFEVDLEVPAGSHALVSQIHLPPFTRTREFVVEVGANELVTVELAYSRLWGNFKKSLTVSRAPNG
jgi:hypothetical protein